MSAAISGAVLEWPPGVSLRSPGLRSYEAASTTAAWKQCTVALDVISVILVASDQGWGNHDIGSGRRTIPAAMGQDRSYCRGRDIGDPDILADHIPYVPVP